MNRICARITVALIAVAFLMALAPASANAACTGPAGNAGQVRYATNYNIMAFCNGTTWVSMAGQVSSTTSGATTLDGLTDVDTTGVSAGQAILFDGATWVASTTVDVRIGSLTNTKWCTSDGTKVNCATNAPVLTEVDPKVGSLTNTKWCTTDGSQVVCTTDAPILTEVDPKVGTLTNTKWCTSDGTQVVCATDAPIVTESDPEVGALTASNFCQVNGGGTAIVCTNDASTQRTALGLGTMATQNANAVAITGGSISGLTGLDVGGIVTATYFEGNGSRLTGISTNADRIVSGSAYAITEQDTGVAVSGTLRLVQATAGTCTGGSSLGTIRVNPATGAIEICRQ